MKKILFTLLLAAISSAGVQAQDVLKEIVKSSTAVCNDTTKDMASRKIAVFKVDECNYMRSKVFLNVLSHKLTDAQINEKVKLLNEQSYAMFQYINLYLKRLTEAEKDKQKALVTQYFKQATMDYPLFHDTDTELIRSYYDRDDYPLQFSLDCNWVQALKVIRAMNWAKLLQ